MVWDGWKDLLDAVHRPRHTVTIGVVGKYIDLADAYKSLNEALMHAGIATRAKINIRYIDAEDIERDGTD